MTRDAFADRLLDLAYGELSRREAAEVEAHAASCEACRAELAAIRGTRGVMAALPAEPAPEAGQRVLLAAAREAAERAAPRRRVPVPRWLLGTTVVAASLVAVGAVSFRVLELRRHASPRSEAEALLGGPASSPRAPAPSPAPGAAGPEERAELNAFRPDRPAPGAVASGVLEKKKALSDRAEHPARAFAAPPPDAVAGVRRRMEANESSVARASPALAEAPASGEARAPSAAGAAPASALPEPPPSADAEASASRRASAPAAKAFASPAPPAARSAAVAAPQREEIRTFEGCEGEAYRRVALDQEGRVVRYEREGRFGGRRVRVVQTFRPDGSPASATARDLDAGGAPVDPRTLGIELAARAADARIDAPPRCGR